MKEILDIVLVFFVLTLLLVPFFHRFGHALPEAHRKNQGIINLMPGRAFAVGLVNVVFFLSVGMVFLIVAERTSDLLKIILTLPALIIFTVLAVTSALGLTGAVQLIGERIAPSQSQWRRHALGHAAARCWLRCATGGLVSCCSFTPPALALVPSSPASST